MGGRSRGEADPPLPGPLAAAVSSLQCGDGGVEGYNTSRDAITDDRGRYRIDPLLTGEEFTLEVTPGESGLLDLKLTRLPAG